MTKINFVTSNAKKYAECRDILRKELLDVDLCQKNIDVPELQTSAENCAREKCIYASQICNEPVLIEDVSLYFSAWETLPGPYVKWFTNGPGVAAMEKMLSSFDDKSAEAVCIYAYCDPTFLKPVLFTGSIRGTIVPPQGSRDFGFDSIFVPIGETNTFAEMEKDYKNSISHRYIALMKFVDFWKKLDSSKKHG